MRVQIDFTKSAAQNAQDYYSASKKAKKKLGGLERGAIVLEEKMKNVSIPKNVALVKKRAREWYEKFHWMKTSEGFLVVSGKDAKSSEFVVKKIMEKKDLYFHADIHGAAHTVLKTGGKVVGENSKKEAAVFAAVFSRAWQEHLPSVDVYSVKPEQVSKSAPSGESIGTGAFMVYGERVWYRKTALEFVLGVKFSENSYKLFAGPAQSVAANSDLYVHVVFGSSSKGDIAKKIINLFSVKLGKKLDINIDAIVALLPTGGMALQA